MNCPVERGREGRVAWIRLNSPEQKNLLTPPAVRALLGALTEAVSSRETGTVLLLQKGDVFCGGIDYSSLADPAARDGFSADLSRLFTVLSGYAVPVVAAVHGACAGGGVGLVAACHLALAATGTKFGVTDIHFGLWPFPFYAALTAAVGPRRARELALTGRAFSAADAQAYGLVKKLSRHLNSKTGPFSWPARWRASARRRCPQDSSLPTLPPWQTRPPPSSARWKRPISPKVWRPIASGGGPAGRLLNSPGNKKNGAGLSRASGGKYRAEFSSGPAAESGRRERRRPCCPPR